MKGKMICPRTCPMLNQYEYCESARRRADQVRECPHRRMRRRVSKLNTVKK
mgnify:CR=1 FL=1